METTNGTMDWSWLIGLLIIAGIFGGNFGFGNNGSTSEISNDFIYTNLANSVRDNANAINSTDRDVLDSKYSLNQDIMQNRYDTSIQMNNIASQIAQAQLTNQANLSSCCCELKTLIHDEGEATRALITQNKIEQLQTDLQSAQLTLAQANQTQNLLNSLGKYVPYNYSYGTTIQ